MSVPLLIDGSLGEGGGQVLRTALALSLCTGRPVVLERIRAGREKPGLRRQHLTALKAAAEVGEALVEGAALGSQRVSFMPRTVRPGSYRFDVGSAGSCPLVLQTVLPALLRAASPSEIVLAGGTHNPMAPPFDFLQLAWLPCLHKLGAKVSVTLDRPGFYPAGGGQMTARIEPASLEPAEFVERGAVREYRVRALVSKLPRHVGERELKTVQRALGWRAEWMRVEEIPDAEGPGNALLIEVHCEKQTEVFTGFGQKGLPAETVAKRAAAQVQAYLEAEVPIGPQLADQLVLPLALAGGGRFVTGKPTLHTTTNLEVIRRFLEIDATIREEPSGRFEIQIGSRQPTNE